MKTDLFDLLGAAGSPVEEALAAISRADASRLRVLVEADDFETAKRAAETFEQMLPSELFRSTSTGISSEELREVIDYYLAHGGGLIGETDRAALLEGRFSEVAEKAVLQWLSPVSGGVPAEKDPFGLLARRFGEIPFSQFGFVPENGMLTARVEGKVFIFLAPVLREDLGLSELIPLVGKISAAEIPGARVHVSGVPLHTAIAAENSRRELNLLSAIGTGGIVLLIALLFRSLRFLVPVVLSIGAGMLGGAAATVLIFPEPHVLTFVFGTTLIGLAADYSFHFYLRGNASIAKPLLMAYLTTILSFSALLLSTFPVLRQMAVFSIVGLSFVLAFVLLFDEKLLHSARLPSSIGAAENFSRKLSAACRALLRRGGPIFAVAVAVGVFVVDAEDDARALYRPSEELAARDRFFMRVAGVSADSAFLVVPGKDAEDVLRREEEIAPEGMCLSAFFPSRARQRENAALVRALFEKEDLAGTLGFTKKFVFAETPPATPDNAPEALRRLSSSFYFQTPSGAFSVVPVARDFPAPAGTFVLTPGDAVSELLESFRNQTIRLFGAAFAALFVALFVVYRRRAFLLLFAPVAAIATVIAVLGYLGVPLSFFHFLSFFLIIGFTLDYSIFRMEGKGRELPVLLSCFTSALSFGLLAFTDFALTRAMGAAIGLGLVFAYFYATIFSEPLRIPENERRRESGALRKEWFEQREQSAGALRLAALWAIYRFCPLVVFRISLFLVSFGIFLFAGTARAASREYLRVLNRAQERRGLPRARFSAFAHMRAFVFSLFDKIDAATLRRQKLRFIVEEDAGFAALRENIAAGEGAFFLCSHIGNIEILQSLYRARTDLAPRVMHAFQDTAQSSVFLEFYRKHCRPENVFIHPTRGIDVGTASEMQDAIARGELVMMAADRISPGTPERNVPATLLDEKILLPKGVFVFARLMACPVFFVACVKTAAREYTFFAEEAPAKDVPAAYAAFLEKLILKCPTEFFHFCRYFRGNAALDGAARQNC